MARLLLAISGALAILATAAIIAIHVTITVLLHHAPTRAVSLLSTALEAVVLITLGYLYSMHTAAFMRRKFGSHTGAPFGVGMFASTLAAAASVATIISLSKASRKATSDSTISRQSFLIGASATLGLSFVFQLMFMVIHFVSSRAAGRPIGLCVDTQTDDDESTTSYVKTIRYSQTSPISTMSLARGDSITSGDRPYSSAEKSYFRATSSLRSSTSKEVRSMSSKTKLLSLREKRRPGSLESYRTSVEDSYSLDEFPSFDKQIDTSCALPRPVFLETIPASPTNVSRSSSPALSDFEPPHMARSRSYSPVARVRERNSSTPSIASSELHIHPLFRSDSPTPPPLATPGTVVLAAPNAGQVIPHRQSVRDLRRMRSGSLPTAPSPLSRQKSMDDFHLKKAREEQMSIQEIKEIQEEEEEVMRSTESPQEMDDGLPPPIPGWILTAGCRNSLTDYNSRKLKSEESI